jgi:hypothetical protein
MTNLLSPDTADFEGGTLGDWTVDAARQSSTSAANSTAEAFTGTHSLKIEFITTVSAVTYVIQMSDVVAGVDVWNIAKTFPLDDTKTYDFEFRKFIYPGPSGSPGTDSWQMHCACFDSSFSLLGYKLVSSGSDSTVGWSGAIGSWNPLAGSVYGALRFAGNGSFGPAPSTNWAVYLDSFRFEEHVAPPVGGWGVGQIRMGLN